MAHEEFREAIGEQLSTKERIETELLREREKLTDSVATLVRERGILVMQLEELQQGGSKDRAVIEDMQLRLATSKKELSESAQHLELIDTERGSLLKEKDDLLAEKDALTQQVEMLQGTISQLGAAKESDLQAF